jgi:hypothetical protein
MHYNVPTKDLMEMIDLMCNHNNTNKEIKHEIRKLSKVLINP